MMVDPAYTFTIPSLLDDLALHCRVYHPECLSSSVETLEVRLKGAIVAHPYAPLGGSYDDPVVLSVTESLLHQGYIVGTFNFRGAEGSEGRSSWTGRGENEDYASFVGFVVHYLSCLRSSHSLEEEPLSTEARSGNPIRLLLGGYSFGSLILARLPPVSGILRRFETAEKGSTCSEVILRSRTLAKHTRQTLIEERLASAQQLRQSIHGQSSPSASPRLRATSVTMGGEETRTSDRRHSRESRKSTDVVREIPHRIKTHIRRHSSGSQRKIGEKQTHAQVAQATGHGPPNISIKYLMISPVLIPFTTTLAPPGLSVSWVRAAHDRPDGGETNSDLLSLRFPTLAVFGSVDSFTSNRKLQQWADRLAKDSQELFEWTSIDDVGHFWREEGALRALRSRITAWISKFDSSISSSSPENSL